MADEGRPREDDPNLPAPGGAGQPPPPDNDVGERPGAGRDFGDSAGYGRGGSALDDHEVGDRRADTIEGRRKPLDDVTKPERPSSSDGE